MDSIRLAPNHIGRTEINDLCDWLKQEPTPQLTKGPLTIKFEAAWAKYIGCQHAVFVNSGSSALLLMFLALQQSKNKRVVIPGLSWATDLSVPQILGFEPLLCDCNMHDLSCDLNMLEVIFRADRPGFLLMTSILGLVPNMEEVVALCQRYGVTLLEDVCESLGSSFAMEQLGSFGLMSAFSMYFGHHISTIEGGMICTDDTVLYERLLMLRSHGWDRDLSRNSQEILRKKFNVSEFDAQFRFYQPGLNVRSTDLQAFLGLGQLKSLPDIVEARAENFDLYLQLDDENLIQFERHDLNVTSLMAFPVISKHRDAIVAALHGSGVETRPLVAGSLARQPAWQNQQFPTLTDCDMVDQYGFYVPAHEDLKPAEIAAITTIINSVAEAAT